MLTLMTAELNNYYKSTENHSTTACIYSLTFCVQYMSFLSAIRYTVHPINGSTDIHYTYNIIYQLNRRAVDQLALFIRSKIE